MTVTLLIANTLFFFVSCLAYGFPPAFPRDGWWALNLTTGLDHLEVWQFLTCQFLHDGLLHLLVNSWVIYTFGRAVEAAVGQRAFLILYLCGGLGGSLAQLGAAALAPDLFGGVMVGASASGLGLLAVYAVLFPERTFTTRLFFIIPVAIRVEHLLWISAALAVFGMALPGDQIAHAAHLGGLVTGIAFAKLALRRLQPASGRNAAQKNAAPPQATVTFVTARPVLSKEPPVAPIAELDTHEFVRQQVDPILDKIHAQGLASLTTQERKVLEQARQRIGKN